MQYDILVELPFQLSEDGELNVMIGWWGFEKRDAARGNLRKDPERAACASACNIPQYAISLYHKQEKADRSVVTESTERS
jgi:hypothetical protein